MTVSDLFFRGPQSKPPKGAARAARVVAGKHLETSEAREKAKARRRDGYRCRWPSCDCRGRTNVLRVNQGKSGGLPEVGLFEADGGAWKLTVVDRVRDWLTEKLPSEVAVLA